MDDDDFNELCDMLDELYKSRTAAVGGLDALHPGGWVSFSKKVRSDLEQWEYEVIARAKAKYEGAESEAKLVRDDFGADVYDNIEPKYVHANYFDGRKK